MAIRNERYSTEEVLRDARAHRAALKSDPSLADLISGVQRAETSLKRARSLREEAEDLEAERFSLLKRADFEQDERLRLVELAVYGQVRKDRGRPEYKQVFPKGLSAIIDLRGEQEARALDGVRDALTRAFPQLAQTHNGEIDRLSRLVVAAETAWKQASDAKDRAFCAEVAARVEVVRALQRSEAGILVVYPGQKARARSFFRAHRRRGSNGNGSRPAKAEEGKVA